MVSSYNEQSLSLVFAITGCVAFSVFASLVNIPIGTASSTVQSKLVK